MENLVVNLTAGVRRETRGGVEYLVAPMTLLRERVLDGSSGPLFYPIDEIRRSTLEWSGCPVTLNHPTRNGKPVLYAEDNDAMTLGFIDNSKMIGNRLTAQAWLDVERTQRLAPELFAGIEAGRPVELSTGLATTNEPAQEFAEFDGVRFSHIARDYKPDHLALLTDRKGACSVEDGCGLLVNAEAEKHFGVFGVPGQGGYLEAEMAGKEVQKDKEVQKEKNFAPFGLPQEYLSEE